MNIKIDVTMLKCVCGQTIFPHGQATESSTSFNGIFIRPGHSATDKDKEKSLSDQDTLSYYDKQAHYLKV